LWSIELGIVSGEIERTKFKYGENLEDAIEKLEYY